MNQDVTPIVASDDESPEPRARLRLDSFVPALVRNLAEGMTASMSRRYTGDFQLTITEWRIILQLAEHQSLHASQIVELTAMEKSKVSRALSHLEQRGLVEREVDESDLRRQRLALSEFGLKMYGKIVPRVVDWERELLEGLGIDEYRELVYLLNKLTTRLREMD